MVDTNQPPPEQEAATSRGEIREWQFQNVLSVLYKRRWVALTTFLVIAAATTFYTLSTAPAYEAHAQLLLTDRISPVTFQGAGEQRDDQRGYLETQNRLLRSRALARQVLEELNLWEAYGGRLSGTGGLGFLDRWWHGPSASNAHLEDTSSPTSPLAESTQLETPAQSNAIDQLLADLRILPVRDTRIIEVRYKSQDPQLATRIVNTLMSAFIRQNTEARARQSSEASAWLTEQLAAQRQKVEASELALQKYRERENSLSLEAGQNIVVQRLNALNGAVTQGKTELIGAEALYRQLAAHQNNLDLLGTFPPIRTNSLVQQIRARLTGLQRDSLQLSASLGAKHPDMVRLDSAIEGAEQELSAEIAKTVESVRQDYLAALSREKQLTAALESQKASALALNRQGIAYGVLLREVESNREIYESLLQRSNEIAVSNDLSGHSIDIVDAAEVPRRPVTQNTSAHLLIGLLVSLVLGIGTALVMEALDDRIQSPAQVKDALGIPFLGLLPYVSNRARADNSLLLGDGVPPAYSEACRTLRTNVVASAGAKNGGRSLLVTSAAPRDGKSVVAVNLAVALGRTGSRVLIVDADLRRPVLHQMLRCKQRPGLSDVLTGACKPSEAIIATRNTGVWLLPSGVGPSNPSEQLGSRRFREFLEKLRESFDWVVVDSPPVMAVTDPAVIAPQVNGVLFVLNARRTRQRIAQDALDRLETAGASFAGAVLNAVTLDRGHYYNSRYYVPCYHEYFTGRKSA